MQIKLSALASIASIACVTLGVATPLHCDQCDTALSNADSPAAFKFLTLLGVTVQDGTALVGITCCPITVIGAGSDFCSAEPVCCTDNYSVRIAKHCCGPTIYEHT